ncbi:MAG: DUF3786 domain-containing protein [Phycisphaerae bacterium]
MTTLNHQQQAQVVSIQRAAATLATIDLTARCAALGLPLSSGADAPVILLRAFGQDLRITPPDFAASRADGKPVRLTDHLLAVHYLLCALPLTPTGQMITFRDLPGGQFYFGPFCSRTTKPLIERIGNNLDLLRNNLNRFDHAFDPEAGGTPALRPVRIHAVGRIEITLQYHVGDEEGPPTADILFDACIKRVYGAEDVAALASRICIGLL